MPQYLITSPDGTKYNVTAPEGASEQDALKKVIEQHQSAPKLSKKEANDPTRIAGMYGKAALQNVASLPDLPATLIEAPGALLNPDKPGASFVENLASGVKSNHFAPNLGEKVGNFVDKKFQEKGYPPNYLEPTTKEGERAVSSIGTAAAAGPFGVEAALGGAVAGDIQQMASQHGASPDQAAALGLIGGGAAFKPEIPIKLSGETLKLVAKGIGKGGDEVANRIEAAQTKSASELHKQVKAAGIKLTGDPETDAESITNWFNNAKSQVADNISKKPLTQDSAEAAQADVSKKYEATKKESTELYNKARKLGEGKTLPAQGLQSDAASIVKSFKDDSFLTTKQQTAMRLLDKWSKRIGRSDSSNYGVEQQYGKPGEVVSYGDLMDLKQALNSTYKPGDPATRPFQMMSEKVNKALEQAGKSHPEFGNAYKAANRHYEEYKNNFGKRNNVLGKSWSEEDARALDANNKRGVPLPDRTRLKAESILGQIDTPIKLDAVTRQMSPENANMIRAAKINEILGESLIEKTSIAENRPLLNALVKNDRKAMAALDKIDALAKELTKRGIKSEMSIEEKSLFRKLYASVVTGVTKGATGLASEAMENAVNPAATNRLLLKNLANEVKKGAPGPKSPEAMKALQDKTPAEGALQ